MRINVTKSSVPDYEEYCREIRSIFETGVLTNCGEKHKALESELEKYLEVRNVVLFTNGHLALEFMIEASCLSGEVITTPFTFASTTHSIVRKGLVPVFCDIDESSCTMDPLKIEALITEKTSAIMPVHVYGRLCDDEKIEKIAEKYGLKVIYDAAHAFGVKKNGVGAANYGNASMFSFHATKVFNTIEGGCVATNDDELAGKLRRLRNFGLADDKQNCLYTGGNGKMNEFQAAMGLCNLRHVDGEIAKRKTAAQRYRENLKGIKGITLPEIQDGVVSNYAYFPVIFDSAVYKASEVAEKLAEKGIGARRYFYPAINEMTAYEYLGQSESTPVASRIAGNVLTLPMFADLTPEDVDEICEIICG